MSSHNLLKEDLKKLETKLHFLENPKIEATTAETKSKIPQTKIPQKKIPEKVEPATITASVSNRRRSTRSASSLAHYKITESLSECEENPKKRKARDVDVSSGQKKPHKEPVAVETEDRGALGCITNSPAKSSNPGRR